MLQVVNGRKCALQRWIGRCCQVAFNDVARRVWGQDLGWIALIPSYFRFTRQAATSPASQQIATNTPTPTATNTPTPAATNTAAPTFTPTPTGTPGPAVSLHASINPTTAFAGENVLQLVVEARDAAGQRATGYLGSIEFVSTSRSTLPARCGAISCGPAPDYTFTVADAGRATFNFAFLDAGPHHVYVYDFYNPGMNTTSNVVDVKEVYLWAEVSPTYSIAGQPTLTLVLEARDEFGAIWPGYRGQVEFVESSPSTLPNVSGSLHNQPDHTFTAANAGRDTFTFAF